jgi:hypothetical protein
MSIDSERLGLGVDDDYKSISGYRVFAVAREYERVADFKFKEPLVYKAGVEIYGILMAVLALT